MSLQNFSYFFFLLITVCVYLQLPKKIQTPFLLLASIAFYAKNLAVTFESAVSSGDSVLSAGFSCALSVGFIAFMAVFVWRAALALDAAHAAVVSATPDTLAAKTAYQTKLLRQCIAIILAQLLLFKYYNLSPLPTLLEGSLLAHIPFPLGISFFTLAAMGYLVDIARGKYAAERSFVHTSVFLFFFATVTSGPICRGDQILPQLHEEHHFDADRTIHAMRLFALGLFKKIAIADLLTLLINQVFGDLGGYGAPMLLLAAFAYSFALYFDFMGYSELARASGMFLGITVPENFKTPFFATNFSGIWTRWHISLSSWFRDYVYIPLGGSHYGKRQRIRNIALTFLLSGLWHGNTILFAVWAVIQVFFRAAEEICHHCLGMPQRSNVPSWKLWSKRAGVFCAWTFGLVFFRIGSGGSTQPLADCATFFGGLTQGWSPALFATQLNAAVASGFYQHSMLQILYLLFAVFTLSLGIWFDCQRFFIYHDAPSEEVLAAQKPVLKWVLYYVLILCIFAGLMIQNGGFAGGSFAYAQY